MAVWIGGARAAVVRVNTTAPYEVVVGRGLLRAADGVLARAGLVMTGAVGDTHAPAVVVTNRTVARHWLGDLQAGLEAWRPAAAMIGDGEAQKALATASGLYDFLAGHGCDRATVVVGLGGGVVCDLAGFVAATYMRGLPLVNVPTTLLAQVDAGFGGKVAVDHPRGKNLVGAFYQPRAVICDVAALSTLPGPVYRDGLAEAVKTAVIGGEGVLRSLETASPALAERDPAALADLVGACVRIKTALVERDERDEGGRMALNLGHTFAHAIEAATGFGTVSHGAAVSVGMRIAGRLAELHGVAETGLGERIGGLLGGFGLPTMLSHLPGAPRAAALRPYLGQDKKRAGGMPRYVLARRPGDVIVAQDVDETLVNEAMAWAEGVSRE